MSTLAMNLPSGFPDQLAELYREFHPRVLKLCRYLLGSEEEAEDASSEVFARLPLAMRTYDRSLPFLHWLTSVANNHCLDRLRRRQIEHRIFVSKERQVPEPIALTTSPLAELLSSEERQMVRDALAALPEKYRQPLVLYYFHDLSYREIARALDLTMANVKTLIFRAKDQLSQAIAQRGYEGGKPAAQIPGGVAYAR
jgi:RNA polymerase sigma-70 factor, ECF subfamily